MYVVGKATRGRGGYAEDRRVKNKKERLVHCNESRTWAIRVEIDTGQEKSGREYTSPSENTVAPRAGGRHEEGAG